MDADPRWTSLMAQMVENRPATQETGVSSLGSIPGLGNFSGEGNSNLLQYSCLENPMDREDWQAVVHRVAESDITEAT